MRHRQPRAVMNVRELPDVCFGPRDIMWWGTFGFIVVEGWTIVLTVVAWVYLQSPERLRKVGKGYCGREGCYPPGLRRAVRNRSQHHQRQ